MTTTVAPQTARDTPPSPVAAVKALAHFEGRAMLGNPIFWAGILGAAALAVFELREQAPVLNRVSVTLAWTMLPLAAAVVLTAGGAVLRAEGRSDAHPPVVAPMTMSQRVGGVLVGLVYPAIVTLVLQLVLLGWVMTRDPVSSMVWTEALVGPVYVVFAGALGAATSRWVSHPSTPVFTVLLLLGLMVVFPLEQELWGEAIGVGSLSPLVWPQNSIIYEFSFRPAGLHLGYLAALVVAMGGVAMLSRRVGGWATMSLGLIVAATLGLAQLGPIAESERTQTVNRLIGDRADLTCETREEIAYCALPGYPHWIDHWAAAVQPVVENAPSEAVEGTELRQYPIHTPFILDGQDFNSWWWVDVAYRDLVSRPNTVPVGTVWVEYEDRILAEDVASHIMGCRRFCQGEAQRLVNLWLVSQNQRIRRDIEAAMSRGDGLSVAECMVAQLWTRSNTQTLIHSNWEALTTEGTTYEEAGDILDVTVPTSEDQYGYLAAGCE